MNIEAVPMNVCPECGKRAMHVAGSWSSDMLREAGYPTVADILKLTETKNIRVRLRQCKKCGCRIWTGEWALLIDRPAKRGGEP